VDAGSESRPLGAKGHAVGDRADNRNGAGRISTADHTMNFRFLPASADRCVLRPAYEENSSSRHSANGGSHVKSTTFVSAVETQSSPNDKFKSGSGGGFFSDALNKPNYSDDPRNRSECAGNQQNVLRTRADNGNRSHLFSSHSLIYSFIKIGMPGSRINARITAP